MVHNNMSVKQARLISTVRSVNHIVVAVVHCTLDYSILGWGHCL